jgi:hypothetical protein
MLPPRQLHPHIHSPILHYLLQKRDEFEQFFVLRVLAVPPFDVDPIQRLEAEGFGQVVDDYGLLEVNHDVGDRQQEVQVFNHGPLLVSALKFALFPVK